MKDEPLSNNAGFDLNARRAVRDLVLISPPKCRHPFDSDVQEVFFFFNALNSFSSLLDSCIAESPDLKSNLRQRVISCRKSRILEHVWSDLL